jgi:hypothetical protein
MWIFVDGYLMTQQLFFFVKINFRTQVTLEQKRSAFINLFSLFCSLQTTTIVFFVELLHHKYPIAVVARKQLGFDLIMLLIEVRHKHFDLFKAHSTAGTAVTVDVFCTNYVCSQLLNGFCV